MPVTQSGPQPEPTLVGQRFGSWLVERQLGHGGMGTVYLARHALIESRAALKVLRADLARDAAFVQRFVEEGRLAARIRHPNTVQVHDLFCLPDGRPCIVMELLEGETLEARAARAPLAPALALELLAQVCDGLAAAHAAGIVHRDVKAENVLLVRRGTAESVKVLDFGIAKRLGGGCVTAVGTVLGTPDYMAPEQIRGRPVDRRADLYAVGVLAFRLLVGRLPFAGLPLGELLEAKQRPPAIPAGLGAPLGALLSRAMALSADERFGSAEELAAALRALAASGAAGPALAAPAAPASPVSGAETTLVRPPTSANRPFEAVLAGGVLELRFASGEAFASVEREELGRGRLWVPQLLPVEGKLRLRAVVPGREGLECEAELVRRIEAGQPGWGAGAGLALALRGRLAPAGTGARTAEVEQLLAIWRARAGQDPYALLGLRPEADAGEITAALRRLGSELARAGRQASPEQQPELARLGERLEQARLTLGRPASRAALDAERSNWRGVRRALEAGLSEEQLSELHREWAARNGERAPRVRELLRALEQALRGGDRRAGLALLERALGVDPLSPGLHRRYEALCRLLQRAAAASRAAGAAGG